MRLETRVLDGDPVTILGFERLLARSSARLVVVGLQRLVLLGREDHGVELAGLFHEDRSALGLGAEAAKAVLGFRGGDAHDGLPGCLAILAIDDHGAKRCGMHAVTCLGSSAYTEEQIRAELLPLLGPQVKLTRLKLSREREVTLEVSANRADGEAMAERIRRLPWLAVSSRISGDDRTVVDAKLVCPAPLVQGGICRPPVAKR